MSAAGVTEQADHVAGPDGRSAVERERDRRQVKVLREDVAAEVGQPNVRAAGIIGAVALNAIDHAVLHGVDVLGPELAAKVHATVAGRPAR